MMRHALKLFSFCAGLLVVESLAAQPALVVSDEWQIDSDGGDSASLDTTGATLLFLCYAGWGTPDDFAISDSKSNTWTELTAFTTSDNTVLRTFYVQNPTVGTGHVFSVGGTNTFPAMAVAAFSGIDTADAFEAATGTAAAAATSVQPGSLTPGQGNSLLGSCLAKNHANTVSVNSSFTIAEQNNRGANNYGVALGYLMLASAGATNPTWSWTDSETSAATLVVFEPSGAAPTRDQEGFRWGIDDGNEASHTFEAAQDTNISIADNQSRLLRTLVNATADPASAAYTLRYQKNGSGGYVAVPVGSTTPGSISNQLVAASSDDAQQSGTTVTLTGTTIGASLDATTEWAAMRFTNIGIPVGATITSAAVGVVPSGTGEDEPLVTVFFENADDCATFTTGASDISNRARTTGVSWSSTDLGATGSSYHNTPDLTSDLQTVINRAGWASGNDLCVIVQGGSTTTRDLTIEAQDLGPNTNPPRLSVAWTTPNEVYITTSANIAAGGEATTARLTAPSGKTTSDFVCTTNCRWDDENGSDTTDITTDDYTEVEWLVFIASSAADGDFFDFRTYAGSSPLDTYTVTPRWTIPGGASGLLLSRRRAFH